MVIPILPLKIGGSNAHRKEGNLNWRTPNLGRGSSKDNDHLSATLSKCMAWFSQCFGILEQSCDPIYPQLRALQYLLPADTHPWVGFPWIAFLKLSYSVRLVHIEGNPHSSRILHKPEETDSATARQAAASHYSTTVLQFFFFVLQPMPSVF